MRLRSGLAHVDGGLFTIPPLVFQPKPFGAVCLPAAVCGVLPVVNGALVKGQQVACPECHSRKPGEWILCLVYRADGHLLAALATALVPDCCAGQDPERN